MTLAIDIQNLSKVYNSQLTALSNISLQVEQGEFFALIGPNGAGKSTLISILTSLVRKTAGKVSILGHDVDKEHLQAKAMMGVMPQEYNFNTFSEIEDVLLTQAGYYGIARREAKVRMQRLLEDLGLWERRKDAVYRLSGGMKRRLMLARAMIHEPQLLILDEPTAGVDIELRRSLWAFLQERNKQGLTIVLTTHYLEEAEQLCRNVAIIDKGVLIRHLATSELLKELDRESFILYPRETVQTLPEVDAYQLRLQEDGSIEVEVPMGQGVSDLFVRLREQGIEIASLRNKANRLEELFVHLTEAQA